MYVGTHLLFLNTNRVLILYCCIVHVCPSFPQGSVCIVHSSVTAPSVCRKNGEALSIPLRGLKYAGLLQSPSKHTEYSNLLWQASFNSAWASWGGEPAGPQPGKWLKLTAKSHRKTPPSTSFCLCLSLPSVRSATLFTTCLWNAALYPATGGHTTLVFVGDMTTNVPPLLCNFLHFPKMTHPFPSPFPPPPLVLEASTENHRWQCGPPAGFWFTDWF